MVLGVGFLVFVVGFLVFDVGSLFNEEVWGGTRNENWRRYVVRLS